MLLQSMRWMKLIRIGVDVRIINFEDIFRKIVELTKILREEFKSSLPTIEEIENELSE